MSKSLLRRLWQSNKGRSSRRRRLKRRHRNTLIESLERREMLASDFTNRFLPLDVSNDSVVSPVDALQIINDLNERGARELGAPTESVEFFIDTTGDGVVAPLDVLLVINHLNDPQPFDFLFVGESDNELVSRDSKVIELGQATGSRTLRLELLRATDTSDTNRVIEDTVSISLVDPADQSRNLLSASNASEPLFQLIGDAARFATGLVTFDGSLIEIDVSSLSQETSGRLLVEQFNSDADRGSKVRVDILSNEVKEDDEPTTTTLSEVTSIDPGQAVETSSLTTLDDVDIIPSNVRFDPATGQYTTDLRLRNRSDTPLSQNVVLEFLNLPAGISVTNRSGETMNGSGYVNFVDAIPFGGFGKNIATAPVRVAIDNPQAAHFEIDVQVLGRENQAPTIDPIADLSISPGEALQLDLSANDADGDSVAFTLRSEMALPTGSLDDGVLTFAPTPGDLGSYSFEIVASDGTSETTQQVQLDVVPSETATTRITGQVLNVDQQPLAGIDVQLGRFQTTTDVNGSFELEVPSFITPTESFDIPVPQGDAFFDPFNTGTQTISLHRAGHDPATGLTRDNPRQHPNLITAFLDGSVVYGSNEERAASLRTLNGDGKLKVSAGDLLPLNDLMFFPDGPLENENNGRKLPGELFAAGDVRANDNVQLLALQTLLVREHNRRADDLSTANPTLTGDELYEHAKSWGGAILQHVTYHEFLPVLLGEGVVPAYVGYDANVDPQISGLFSGAAFRIGHSMASADVLRLDETGMSLPGSALSLRDAFFNPDPIKNDGIEAYLLGMTHQQAEEVDAKLIGELRNFLFGPPGSGGLDLIALNIQRGRDLGLPSYNQARLDMGLAAATSFAEVSSSVDVQNELSSVYASVDDIDMIVGGLAEDHVAGSMVGELFHRVLLDQFIRSRDGDRFWYENQQFTQDDLDQIRGTTLRDVILRNTTISALPNSVFVNGSAPAGPNAGGSASSTPSSAARSFDGSGNNTTTPLLGSAGQNLLTNYTQDYGNGIGSPAGDDRPGARSISNAVFDQDSSLPNAQGATTMLMIWGQLVAHDITLTPGGTDDTLKIHGDSFPGAEVYPFVAEKLPLVLGHDLYAGADNDLTRPIYLPVLDVAGGTTIDPVADTTVQQQVAPGETASVFVAAGTLERREGQPFDGTLSITEVPPSLTPAALPEDLLPDLVVTIQPGEMVFTQPAPLTLPNRVGYPAGEEMELWSINPTTGTFEVVGMGRVSNDGTAIETIDGGIRNSSWHFFSLQFNLFRDLFNNPRNERDDCTECGTKAAPQTSNKSGGCPGGSSGTPCSDKSTQTNGSDGSSGSQGGRQSIVPNGTTYGYSPLSPEFSPGANPFSQVELPAGLDLNFPTFDFPDFDSGLGPAPSLNTSGATSSPNSGGGLYNPFGFGIGSGSSGPGTNTIHSGAGFGAVQGASPINPEFAPGNNPFSQADISGQLDALQNVDLDSLLPGLATQYTTSEVELHSGSQIESHELVTYYSLGADRGLSFTYDSRRADPIHSVAVGFDSAQGAANRLLLGKVDVMYGGFKASGGKPHLRKTPPGVNNIELPVPVDLTGVPSGVYKYKATAGLVQANNLDMAGRMQSQENELVHVNTTDSPYGAGWGIDGLVQLSESTDGQVLWIDGSGAEHVYRPIASLLDGSTQYESPAGDFSVFEKLASGRFRQTTKTGNVIDFDTQNRIVSETDRIGNQIGYEYDAVGRLTKMIDPVGLETALAYSVAGRLASVTDSAGRVTTFEHDDDGNLTRIGDPDGTFRTFEYDSRHHLTAEVDKRGNREEVFYDELGRVSESMRRDKSVLQIEPLQQSEVSIKKSQSLDAELATRVKPPQATFVDGNGNVRTTTVDQAGLQMGQDDEEGALPDVVRDANNLVLQRTDGRGNVTLYTYDELGNLLTMQDQVARDASQALPFDSLLDSVTIPITSTAVVALAAGDVNGDGITDIITQGRETLLAGSDGSLNPQVDLGSIDGRDVQLADLNGDGNLDRLTLRRSGGDQVVVDLGDGAGGFTFSQNIGAERADHDVRAFTTGDFDGDGNVDVFIGLIGSNRFSLSDGYFIAAGRGDGTFDPAAFVSFVYDASGTQSIVTADIDSDGDLDVILGHNGGVRILLNDSTGAFTAGPLAIDERGSTIGGVQSVSGLVARDLTGDGRMDLVASFPAFDTVVAIQQQDGTFTRSRLNLGGSPTATRVADMNGDQIPDLVIARGQGEASVLLQSATQTGTFTTVATVPINGGIGDLVLLDLDGDSDLDIVAGSPTTDTVAIALNPGDGSFRDRSFDVADTPVELRLGDFNNDGIDDVLSLGQAPSSRLTFRPGLGDGSFDDPVNYSTRLNNANSFDIADLDGDGDLDAVVTGSNAFSVLLNNGDGTFATADLQSRGGNQNHLRLGDMNGDGNPDLVTAASAARFAPGNGDGTFGSFTLLLDITGDYGGDALGDLNNDGFLDIAMSRVTSDQEIHVFMGNGDGTFSDVQVIDPGSIAGRDLEIADVNDDGNADLVSYGSTRLSVVLGDGSGGFTVAQNDVVDSSGSGTLEVADVDLDGVLDVVAADFNRNRINVFRGLGDGTFNTTPETFAGGLDPRDVKLADLDDDGDLDVVTGGFGLSGGAVFVSLNRTIEPERCDGACRVINTYEPAFNQLTSTTDELGRRTIFEIDPANGNTLSVRRIIGDDDGGTIVDDLLTTMTYTPQGLVETITDPLGRVVEYDYDQFGRQTRMTMAVGSTIEADYRTEYDAAGNVSAIIDENGNRSEMTYDELNRATRIVNALGDDVQMTYDENGNVTSTTDLNGNTTRTEYDEMDRPVTMIDATGNAMTMEYDRQGNLIRTTDRLKRVTEFHYDRRNRLVETINAENGRMTYDYDFDNNITAMTDENGNRTDMRYDARDRLVTEIDALGGATNTTYDTVDNLIAVSDELRRTTTFEYDDADRLITMTLPDPDGDGPSGAPVYFSTYDLASNLISSVDPLGNETVFGYDDRDRMIEQVDPDPDGAGPLESPRTQFTYDGVGNVLSISDPLDRVTTYEYDNIYRVIRMTLPDPDQAGPDTSPAYVTRYDPKGNVISEVDPLGNETTFTYDDRYVLTQITAPDPDGAIVAAGNQITRFTYDAEEQLVETADPLNRVTQYEYDLLGRNIATILPDPDAAGPDTTPVYTNVFDPFGNVVTMVDPLGNRTELEYDALHRLVRQTDPDPDGPDSPLASPVTTFEYDAVDQILSASDPLQRVTRFDYDLLGRIVTMTEPDPDQDGPDASPVTTYDYDLVDNELSMTDPLGNTTEYEYDNLYRMTRRIDPDPDGPGPLESPEWDFAYDIASQLVESLDPLNRATQFEYDNLGRVVRVTEPDPDQAGPDASPVTTYQYDLVDNERSMTDPLGNTTEYEYDDLYRMTRKIDPDPDAGGPLQSPEWEYEYDIANQLVTTSDPLDRMTGYEYDDLGRVFRMTQPDPDMAGPDTSPITTYVYDLVGNELSMTDPLGNVTTYDYDNLYRPITTTEADPDGVAGPQQNPVWRYSYDVASQMLSTTDPLGRVTSYEYDDLSRVISIAEPDPDRDGPLASPVTMYDYDLMDNELSMTDSLGNVTQYEYDNLYRLVQRTDPDPDGPANPLASPVWNWTYDVASQLLSASDPLDRVTLYQYDDLSRVIQVTDPDPDQAGPLTAPVMTYAYDLVGNELSMTDSLGNVTEYEYDNLYRMVQRTDPDPDGPVDPLLSPVTTYAYDVASQMSSMTDPLNRTTEYRWDDLGRRVEVTYPDPDLAGPGESPRTIYTYDLIGNVLSDTDGLGHTRTYSYDNLYRPVTDTDANGDATLFEYDLVDNLLSLTDPVSNLTSWEYDDLNRVVRESNPLDDVRTYEYDSEGNLIRKVDRNGRPTVYDYDNLYRQTTEIWLDGNDQEVHRFDYSYDVASQMLSAVDAFDAMTYVYDDLGRVIQKSYDITGLDPVITFDQTFDSENNRLGIAAAIGTTDDFVTSYTYDDLYRPIQIAQTSAPGSASANAVAEKRLDFTWDIASQRTSAVRFADLAGTQTVVATTFAYDRASRITDIDHRQAATDLAGYELTWDAGNRISRWESLVDGVVDYNYDDRNQLTGADYDLQTDETYQYDENGNRIGGDHDTGLANRLREDATFTYEYDAEGNRSKRTNKTTGEVTEYDWDHRNRLVRVTTRASDSGVITEEVIHSYDANNRWIRRQADTDGAGPADFEDTFFIQDGNNIVLQFDGTAESDVSHRYLWGTRVDEIMAAKQVGGELLWSLADHLGSVRDIVVYDPLTGATTVANHIVYDSFGNVVSVTDPAVSLLFGFTGRPFDIATGMQNNLNRWYDAQAGFWLSEDPISFGAGDVNLYRYIANTPIFGFDSDGLRGRRVSWYNRLDRFSAGFSDAVTFGGTTWLRKKLYGRHATKNHRGTAFHAGQGVGVGTSFALGFGAAGNTARAAQAAKAANAALWAKRTAQAYTAIGDAVGVYQSVNAYLSGCYTWTDSLGLIPVAGFLSGKTKNALRQTARTRRAAREAAQEAARKAAETRADELLAKKYVDRALEDLGHKGPKPDVKVGKYGDGDYVTIDANGRQTVTIDKKTLSKGEQGLQHRANHEGGHVVDNQTLIDKHGPTKAAEISDAVAKEKVQLPDGTSIPGARYNLEEIRIEQQALRLTQQQFSNVQESIIRASQEYVKLYKKLFAFSR